MSTHADKAQENKSQSLSKEVSQQQNGGESTFGFADNRPEAVAQRTLQDLINNSPRVKQLRVFQELTSSRSSSLTNSLLQRKTDMTALSETIGVPEFQTGQGGKTVKELIDEKGDIERDENYNNVEKREFEEALATVVFHNLDAVWAPVAKVSRNIWEYISRKNAYALDTVRESFAKLHAGASTLGVTGFDTTDPTFSITDGIKVLLDQSRASLPTHLNIHGKFYANIYRDDYLDGTARTMTESLRDVDYGAVSRLTDEDTPDDYHPLKTFQPPDLFEMRPGELTGRPRRNVPEDQRVGPAGNISGLIPRSNNQELGIPRYIKGRPTSSQDQHNRGIDLFFIDEAKTWTQRARIQLDMPISAGPSGSTAYMLSAAMEMGLGGGQDLRRYVMALVGSMVAGGHHTFHEIMTVARIAGIPYQDGDYSGVFPDSLMATDDFQRLIERYPQFLG